MRNYASAASPPKGGGGAVAQRAAGARPPLLVVPHRREASSPKDQRDAELRERSEPAEGGGGRGRVSEPRGAAWSPPQIWGSGRAASRGGKTPFVSRSNREERVVTARRAVRAARTRR